MSQTIEAEIDADGTVRLREPVAGLGKPRRALVIVLEEPPAPAPPADEPIDYSQFLPPPVDERHRRLRALATPCGTPPPGTTYSREEIYD